MIARRETLRAVQSGLIQISFNGVLNRIEFNCNCMDALSICGAQCCRTRSGYSVELEPDEVDRFQSAPHPTRLGTQILKKSNDGLRCWYLDDERGLCTIYERRPLMCRQWHCSPHGQTKDDEIVVRDAGWTLVAVRKEEEAIITAQLQEEV